jgi:Fe-S cluster biogenesis protein NfuA
LKECQFRSGGKRRNFLWKDVVIMEDLAVKIAERLDQLRSCLQADGGDLEVVSIEGKLVKLRLRGACGSCPHATMTIKEGLERILREELDPEITLERVM